VDLSRRDLHNAESWKRAGEWVPANSFVFAYADLHDTNETLHWLDSMVVEHDPMLWNIPMNPGFDFLRDDPRYREWEAKAPWRLTPVTRGDTAIQGQ